MKTVSFLALSLCFAFANMANGQEAEPNPPPHPARLQNPPRRDYVPNRAPRVAPAPAPQAPPANGLQRQNALPGQQFHRLGPNAANPDMPAPAGMRRFDQSMSVADRQAMMQALEQRRRAFNPTAAPRGGMPNQNIASVDRTVAGPSGTRMDWRNRIGTNGRADWRNGNGGGTSGTDWRLRNGGTSSSNWQGSTNTTRWGSYSDAYRRYDRRHHDRNWWQSHYPRISLVSGGYYYWDAGYWYPAWGYDPYYSNYAYDGPIYGYDGLALDQEISQVQAALQEEGYYRGAVDGVLGPMTRQAIAAYQRDRGLAITTVIDQPTLQSLGL